MRNLADPRVQEQRPPLPDGYDESRREHSPPFRIRPARKGPGSVVYTSRLLHAAMVKGDLTIHPRCVSLVDSFRHWRGPGGDQNNRDLSHALDAARYIGRSFLDTRSGGVQTLRVR